MIHPEKLTSIMLISGYQPFVFGWFSCSFSSSTLGRRPGAPDRVGWQDPKRKSIVKVRTPMDWQHVGPWVGFFVVPSIGLLLLGVGCWLFVVVCCCLLLCVVVCCCLLLTVVVCCCLLLFVVVCCWLLLFVVVCCWVLLFVVVCCCLLLFVVVPCCLLLLIVVCCCL